MSRAVSGPAEAAPAPELPRSTGFALGTGTVLQGFNSSIIAVALIAIGAHFGDRSLLPWLVSGMYIACAVASPSAGRFVDLFGARRLYLIGLGIVLVTAIAGPLSPSLGWLIADRIVMGIGASFHFPAAMTIVRRLSVSTGASGRTALGAIALSGQTIAAIGPSIGGVIVLAFGWQGIFWVNIPLVLLSAAFLLRTVPGSVDAVSAAPSTAIVKPSGLGARTRSVLTLLDLPGLALFVLALVSLMVGFLGLDAVISGDAGPLVFALAALPIGALFVLRELRTATPFVDIRLLAANPQVLKTCGRGVVTFIAFYAVFYGLPQWFESERGLSPAVAGLLMVPVFGLGVVSTAIATATARRLRPRMLLVIGGAVFALAGALLALTVSTDAPVWLLILVGGLLGIPNGFNNIGNQSVLQATAPAEGIGVASGLYRTSQYIGAALSTAAVTLLIGSTRPNGGIQALGILIGVIGLVLVVLNLVASVRDRAGRVGAAGVR
jgi:MFS family permease